MHPMGSLLHSPHGFCVRSIHPFCIHVVIDFLLIVHLLLQHVVQHTSRCRLAGGTFLGSLPLPILQGRLYEEISEYHGA